MENEKKHGAWSREQGAENLIFQRGLFSMLYAPRSMLFIVLDIREGA
ncbi:MAG TPA: hypothetical protein VF372_06180 [Thermodesulfobacteriota bacterium]